MFLLEVDRLSGGLIIGADIWTFDVYPHRPFFFFKI